MSTEHVRRHGSHWPAGLLVYQHTAELFSLFTLDSWKPRAVSLGKVQGGEGEGGMQRAEVEDGGGWERG